MMLTGKISRPYDATKSTWGQRSTAWSLALMHVARPGASRIGIRVFVL